MVEALAVIAEFGHHLDLGLAQAPLVVHQTARTTELACSPLASNRMGLDTIYLHVDALVVEL